VGLDVAPSVTFTFAPSYSFERYNALSRSRQANPGVQFDDASRNWATDATDRVHSFLLSAGLTQLADKVDVLVSYDYNKATATYNYITGAVPNRTLPDELVVDTTLPPPTQLPPTLSQLNRATADITYAVTGRVSLGFSYWYEDYKVKDFTLDADANLDLVRGQILLIGYLYKPYTANTFWGRLIYRW
jgi:opacity protein-like surface antigen